MSEKIVTYKHGPWSNVIVDGQRYALLSHEIVNDLVGALMELLDILPDKQGDAIKKLQKRAVRDFVDDKLNEMTYASDLGEFAVGDDGYETAFILKKDLYIRANSKVRGFDTREEALAALNSEDSIDCGYTVMIEY